MTASNSIPGAAERLQNGESVRGGHNQESVT